MAHIAEKIDFKQGSKRSMENPDLRKALYKATDLFRAQRAATMAANDKWDDLRNRAREIKRHTIENLDYYLEMLEESVTRAGGIVHWARDGLEAARIITDIAHEHGVKRVVKSKSMATEEIELNGAFDQAGIGVVETDLGEYIIQLAGERPSHIIAPAIHKTKHEISELFAEKLGIPYQDDPQGLTAAARERLRGEFLNADMGVSGVNFAAADTGTIAIVENEGNSRLTTTLPRVHVALMGMEKILPRFSDLSLFLSLLIKSATGQKLSTYISLITGPKNETDIDGPEEFHLVILDNGRTKILSNPHTRESLYCLRCGACLNICPVYRQVGGHAYGGIYSGPIGAIITPQLLGVERAPDLPFASTLCGACRDVCPVIIDIPKVLLQLREQAIKSPVSIVSRRADFLERVAVRLWRFAMEHSSAYGLFTKLAYWAQLPFKSSTRSGDVLRSAPFLSGWTETRDFPLVARTTFRERWKRSLKYGGGGGGDG